MRSIVFILLLRFAATAGATNYYVNSQAGDDVRSGTSRTQAWRTLTRVNQQVFQPGDEVLFKAGTRYTGQLKPQGSGAEGNPIRIGKYGLGGPPRIDGQGEVLDTLLLRNVEFWEMQDLEITNLGPDREPGRTGVRIVAENFGKLRHIQLRRLFVHDVNGDLRKTHEGCGIYFETLGKQTPSHFDDLSIEDCRVLQADRNGICQRNGSGPHSVRVVIRGNLLEDIGGDCIKPWGSDGPLVEHNTVRGGRMRCDDGAAGIWPFDCNDALIQFNEVSGVKGIKDGQGFDSDYQCRRSVFQYNYSHDNEGGFMLICSPGDSFNEDTVIRYNISQNDGINTARVFQFGGGSSNTLVYNNTIYIGTNQNLPLLEFGSWEGGHPDGAKFFNNLFYVDGRVTYKWGSSTNLIFGNNVFYGNHSELPSDAFAITNRPALCWPGGGSIKGYRPASGSKFPRGQIMPNNGGRDFFGNAVPADRPPSIGAVEGGRD
jgi:hypothetical protein